MIYNQKINRSICMIIKWTNSMIKSYQKITSMKFYKNLTNLANNLTKNIQSKFKNYKSSLVKRMEILMSFACKTKILRLRLNKLKNT